MAAKEQTALDAPVDTKGYTHSRKAQVMILTTVCQ